MDDEQANESQVQLKSQAKSGRQAHTGPQLIPSDDYT